MDMDILVARFFWLAGQAYAYGGDGDDPTHPGHDATARADEVLFLMPKDVQDQVNAIYHKFVV
jgi:hypothetical protein